MNVSHNEPGPHEMLAAGVAARLAGVTVGTLRRWEREGRISASRTPGGQRRFRRDEVEALLTPSDSPASSSVKAGA